MANADVAFGFRPVGSVPNHELIECVALSTYNTALFVGDAVKLGGSGDIKGRPSIEQAAAADASILGVITGFLPSGGGFGDFSTHRGEASTTRVCTVALAVQTRVFEVNCSASIDVDGIGNGYDIIVGSGSTVTGQSGMELDVSTAATTGRTLRLLRLVQRPDNEIGASGSGVTGCKAHVIFAESLFNNGAGA